MAKENHCPQCGAELTPDAPEGLCPRCLMEAGLENDAGVTIESPGVIEGPGTTIGRYKLLELIGEGGMGLVYLAEQQEPVRRRVALKIIKPGMDSKSVIARFEAERQVLALLDHPNIAHVFDAGTTEAGRPYFVMEHVKGMSINKYCDRHKLSIEQRLKLFLQVCYAVHHAHQKGIIHRDIKPSNVLVSVQDDRAIPKIIDFGIAKAVTQPLTEQTLFTRQGQLLGTPEYMSPEQADMANQDIDTRADIYSLGVVLYELLTGVLPFDHKVLEKAGFIEVQRILQEEEPPRPSTRLTSLGEEAKKIAERRHTQVVTLARRLHRELEWIPLKAMRKERARRYRSASELADDIQNYLNGAPLIAGPETAIYRVKKFVRKHAGSVATVLLVAVALILGFVVSTTMYFRAERARARAEKAEMVAQEQRTLAEGRAEDYRRALYVNRIALADASYRDGTIRRVRKLLESCPADLRGWEWHRLQHIANQSITTIAAHETWILDVSFNSDGKRIVSTDWDRRIKIWDAVSGERIAVPEKPRPKALGVVSFSPNDKWLVWNTSDDGKIKIWDAGTGAEVLNLQGHSSNVTSVTFSPDGKRIASSNGWDKTITLWDAATGAELTTLRGHEDWVADVSFSPDGKRIVSGGDDGTIRVWDVLRSSELLTLASGKVLSIAFSPDGKQIVSAGKDRTVKLWDSESGIEVMTFRGHQSWVFCALFRRDGKQIISGSGDKTVKVWDVATGAEIMTLRGHDNTVRSVAFHPDGKHIVSGGDDGTVRVWDLTVNREVFELGGNKVKGGSVAFSPDGRRIVGSDENVVKVWDVASGAELMNLPGHKNVVLCVAWSPDGKRIASGSLDNTVKVWEAETGAEMATLRGHGDRVFSVAFSLDGHRIISGSTDATVKLWDAVTGAALRTLSGHHDEIYSVAFSPDGKRIVSGSMDKTIRVWDAATGTEVMTLRGHKEDVHCVAFSPDGTCIVSGGYDRSIKIWDAVTGMEKMTLRGHGGGVSSIVFSPDGTRIVSAGRDHTVKLWDAETGNELMTFRGHEFPFWSATLGPDGHAIAAACGDRTIKLWESKPPISGYGHRRNAEAARKLVDELYEKHGLYQKVIDKLKADKTLDESVRKVALQIANARRWEDAEKLKKQSPESASPEKARAKEKTESR